ncbi:hypothetical protein EDEG_01462 [Edhazardia aedis USNM 41457]|uniref:Uncharacterized protein n=1 Tax=Edhazardia aedis (strain USNM 41457) TaxID=1003232 RepID=J9DNZ5_EDHAE|nr:hypothetical protein EDEG_01462 [Edhazardia aedis USNM 41457]|eukprot:EJW04270.1 hypothetical protein EDEG_01462 [Edhazardia aedis USNM 41457]
MFHETLLELPLPRVKGLCFHPKLPILLITTHTGQIISYDYSVHLQTHTFLTTDGPIRTISFNTQNDLFISGGDDTSVNLFKFNTKEIVSTYKHNDYVRSVSFHPTLPLILSTSDDMTIKVYNFLRRKVVATLSGHSHYVMSAAFYKNYIISAGLDNVVRVWDYFSLVNQDRKHKGASVIVSHENENDRTSSRIQSINAHPNGQRSGNSGKYISSRVGSYNDSNCEDILSSGADENLTQKNRTLNDLLSSANVFKQKGQSFANDKISSILNLPQVTVKQIIEAHDRGINCVYPFDNGFITASDDRTVKVFMEKNGMFYESECFFGHNNNVTACCLFKRYVVSVGEDGNIIFFRSKKIKFCEEENTFDDDEFVNSNSPELFRISSDTRHWCIAQKNNLLAVGHDSGFTLYNFESKPLYCINEEGAYYVKSKRLYFNDYVNELLITKIFSSPIEIKCIKESIIPHTICYNSSDDNIINITTNNEYRNLVIIQYDSFFEIVDKRIKDKKLFKSKGKAILRINNNCELIVLEVNILKIYSIEFNKAQDLNLLLSKSIPVKKEYNNLYYSQKNEYSDSTIILSGNKTVDLFDISNEIVLGSVKFKGLRNLVSHSNVYALIGRNNITFVDKKMIIIANITEMVDIVSGIFICDYNNNSNPNLNENSSISNSLNNINNNLNKKVVFDNTCSLNFFTFAYSTTKHLKYTIFDGVVNNGILKSIEKHIYLLFKENEFFYYFYKDSIENLKINPSEIDLKTKVCLINIHNNISNKFDIHKNININSYDNSNNFTPTSIFNNQNQYNQTLLDIYNIINSGNLVGVGIISFLNTKNLQNILKSAALLNKNQNNDNKSEHMTLINALNAQNSTYLIDKIASFTYITKKSKNSLNQSEINTYLSMKNKINNMIHNLDFKSLQLLLEKAIKNRNIKLIEKVLWKQNDFWKIALFYISTKQFNKISKLSNYGDDNFKLILRCLINDFNGIDEILFKNNIVDSLSEFSCTNDAMVNFDSLFGKSKFVSSRNYDANFDKHNLEIKDDQFGNIEIDYINKLDDSAKCDEKIINNNEKHENNFLAGNIKYDDESLNNNEKYENNSVTDHIKYDNKSLDNNINISHQENNYIHESPNSSANTSKKFSFSKEDHLHNISDGENESVDSENISFDSKNSINHERKVKSPSDTIKSDVSNLINNKSSFDHHDHLDLNNTKTSHDKHDNSDLSQDSPQILQNSSDLSEELPQPILYNKELLQNYREFIKDINFKDSFDSAMENVTVGKFTSAITLLKEILYSLTGTKNAQQHEDLRRKSGKYLGALLAEKKKKKIEDLHKILSISYNFSNIASEHKSMADCNLMLILFKNSNFLSAKKIAKEVNSRLDNITDLKEADQNALKLAKKILKSKKDTDEVVLEEGVFCIDSLSSEKVYRVCNWCSLNLKGKKCVICHIGTVSDKISFGT